jgi:hypothetical protein
MEPPCGAVVSLIRGDTASVLRGLDLLEQSGMIAFFDTKDTAELVPSDRQRIAESWQDDGLPARGYPV